MGERDGNQDDGGGGRGGGGGPAVPSRPRGASGTTTTTTPSPRRRSPRGQRQRQRALSGSPRRGLGGDDDDDDDAGVGPGGGEKVRCSGSTSTSSSVSWTKTLMAAMKPTLPSAPPPRRRSPRKTSSAGAGGDGGMDACASSSSSGVSADADADAYASGANNAADGRVRISEGGKDDDDAVVVDRRLRAAAEEEGTPNVEAEATTTSQAVAAEENNPPPSLTATTTTTTTVEDEDGIIIARAWDDSSCSASEASPGEKRCVEEGKKGGHDFAGPNVPPPREGDDGGGAEEGGEDGGDGGDGAPTPDTVRRPGPPDPVAAGRRDAPEQPEVKEKEGDEGVAAGITGGDHRCDDAPETDGRRAPRGEVGVRVVTTPGACVGPRPDFPDDSSAAAAAATLPVPLKSMEGEDDVVIAGRGMGSEDEDGGGGRIVEIAAATATAGPSARAEAGARAGGDGCDGGGERTGRGAAASALPVSFVEDMEECDDAVPVSVVVASASPTPKRRGRPKGSKNNANWTQTTTPVGRRSRSRTSRSASASEASPTSARRARPTGTGTGTRTRTRTPRKQKIEEGDDDWTDAPSRKVEGGGGRRVVYAGANGRRGTDRRVGVLGKRKRRGLRADAADSSLHSEDDDDGAGAGSADCDVDGDGMSRCEGLCCRILRGRRRSGGGRPLGIGSTAPGARDKKEEQGRRCVQCGELFPRAWRMVSDAERVLATSTTLRDSFVASIGDSDPSSSSSYRPTPHDGDEYGGDISMTTITTKLTLRRLEDALDLVVRDLPSWPRSSKEEEECESFRRDSSSPARSREARTMALHHISETLDLSLDDDEVEEKEKAQDKSDLVAAASGPSHLDFLNLLRGDGVKKGKGGVAVDGRGSREGGNGLIRQTASVPLLCECVPRKKVGFGPPPDEERGGASAITTGPQDAKGGRCCDRCGRLKRAPHLHPHQHQHHVSDAAGAGGAGVETAPPPPRCRACGGERGLPPKTAASVGDIVVVCGSCRLLSLTTRNSLRRRLEAVAERAGVSISPSDFEDEEDQTHKVGGGKKRKFPTRRNTTSRDAGSSVSKRRTRGGECRNDDDGDDESVSGMDDAQPRAPSDRRRRNNRRSSRADERRPATTCTSNKATIRRKGGRPRRQQPRKKTRSVSSRGEGPSSSGKVRRSSFKSSSLGEESPDEYSLRLTRARRPPRRASGGSSFVRKRNERRLSDGESSEEDSSSSGGGSTSSSDDDDDESFVDNISGSGRARRGRGNQCSGDGPKVDKDTDGATGGGGAGASPCLRFRDDVASKRNALRRVERPQVEALSQLLDDLPRSMSPQLLLPTTAYAQDGTHGNKSGEHASSRDAESSRAPRRHLDELRIIGRIVQTRHAAGDYDGARRLCESALNDYASRARALISSAGSSSCGGANASSQQRPSVASTSVNSNGSAGHTLPDEQFVVQCEMQRIVSGLWCLLASLVGHCPSSLHSSLVDGSSSKFVEKRRCVEQIHKLATRCDVANKGGAVWIAHGRFLAEEDSTPNDNAEFVTGDDDTPGGKNHNAVDSVAGALNARARSVLRDSLRASADAVEKEVAADPLIMSLTERASICNDLNLLTSATSHQRSRATFTDHAGVGRRVTSNAAVTDEREEGDLVGTSSLVRSLQLVCPSCRQQLESHEALREHSFDCSLSERHCEPNDAFGSTPCTRGPLVDIIVASTSTSTGRRSNSRSKKRNRVGIRCRPCHVASRAEGSGDTNTTGTPPHVTYPKSTSRLWEDVRRMYNDHLTSCPHVRPDPKGEKVGIGDDGSSSEFRWYWDAISRRLGFVAATAEYNCQDSLRAENRTRTTGELRNNEDGLGTKATIAACSGNSCSKRACVDKAGPSGKKRKWNWAADCVNLLGEHADGRLEMPSVRSARSKAPRERILLSKRVNANDHDVLDESSDETRAGRSGGAPRPRTGARLIVESASQYWHDIRKARALIPMDVGRAFYAQQSRSAMNTGERELSMSPDAVRCRERRMRIREESNRAADKGVEKRNEGGPICSNDNAGISNVGDETGGALGWANDTLVDYDRDIEIATEYLLALYTHFVPCRTRPVEAEQHCKSRMYLCCKHCQKVVPSRGIPVNMQNHAVKSLRNHLLDECSEVSAPSKADLRDLQARRDRSADSASFFQRVSERYCSAVSVTTTENTNHTTDGVLAHPNSTASQAPSTAPNVPTCDANKDDIEHSSLQFGQQVFEHKNDDSVEMSRGVNAVDVDATTPCGDCSTCDSELVCSTKNYGVTCNDGNIPCSGKRDSCGQPEAIPRLPEEKPGASIHADTSLVGKSTCSLNEFREAGMVSTSNFTPDPATVLPLEV